MATKDMQAQESKRSADALPEIIGDARRHQVIDPHKLPEDVDPAWAGDYELTLGRVRLGDTIYIEGATMRLGALDGHRFTALGVVKRIDGKRPDRVEKPEIAASA